MPKPVAASLGHGANAQPVRLGRLASQPTFAEANVSLRQRFPRQAEEALQHLDAGLRFKVVGSRPGLVTA